MTRSAAWFCRAAYLVRLSLTFIQPPHSKENHMAKPMTAFTTDLQHSGMIAKDLDETIKFYREVMGFELAGLFMNGENRCAFLRYGHLTIETWEGDPAPMTTAEDAPPRTSALSSRASSTVRSVETRGESAPGTGNATARAPGERTRAS